MRKHHNVDPNAQVVQESLQEEKTIVQSRQSIVASVLPESRTTNSSAQDTLSKQAALLCSSFDVITTTLTYAMVSRIVRSPSGVIIPQKW